MRNGGTRECSAKISKDNCEIKSAVKERRGKI